MPRRKQPDSNASNGPEVSGASTPSEAKSKKRRRKKSVPGLGSVYPRKDGRWGADFIVEETGKRKTVYGRTAKEAAEKLQQALFEQKQGTFADGPKQKLETFLNHWLEDVHKPTVRVSSYKRYRIILDKHLIPYLGHIQIQKLTAQHVQSAYAKILKDGYKPATVRAIHAVLHKALGQAVRWHLVGRNVCNEVSLPRVPKFEIHPLTKEQAQKLLDVARGDRFEAMLVLALLTGMRRGEILGLRWSDIDFESGTLHIRRSVNHITGYGFIETEPKTAASIQVIPLPEVVIDVLRQHRLYQLEAQSQAGAKWQERDLVFCNKIGGFFSLSQLYQQYRKLLSDAGLPRLRFHDLRHSAATILLTLGIHPKVVQERLGHSKIAMTMDTYSHVLPTMQEEASERLDDLFRREK